MKKAWKPLLIACLILFLLGNLLVVVSAFSGGSVKRAYKSMAEGEYAQSFDEREIDSIRVEITGARICLKNGDEFRVEAKDIPEDYFQCHVSDGTLVVADKKPRTWISFPGLRWNLDFLKYEPEVTIYIPAGFEARRVDLDLAAGHCSVSGLTAGQVSCHLNAGELRLSDIRADSLRADVSAGLFTGAGITVKRADLNLSAGELAARGLLADEIETKLSAGSAFISGTVSGSGDFDCGVGRLSLELEGKRDEYNIKVKAGLGRVEVDGSSYSGNVSQEIQGLAGGPELTLECGLGEIQLRFMD